MRIAYLYIYFKIINPPNMEDLSRNLCITILLICSSITNPQECLMEYTSYFITRDITIHIIVSIIYSSDDIVLFESVDIWCKSVGFRYIDE